MVVMRLLVFVLILSAAPFFARAQSTVQPTKSAQQQLDAARDTITDLLKTTGSLTEILRRFGIDQDQASYRYNRLSTLQVKADVLHDHEKFVFGSPYSLRVSITNDTELEFTVDPKEVTGVIPVELMLDRTIYESVKENIRNGQAVAGGLISKVCTTLNVPSAQKDGRKVVVVPAHSVMSIAWDCEYDNSLFSIGTFFKKASFRPDTYTFVVNVPLRFKHNLPGKGEPVSLDDIVVKSASVQVATELDSMFIALSSIVGAIIASISKTILQFIPKYKTMYDQYRYTVARDFSISVATMGMYLIVAVMLPPLFVVGANITQNFQYGFSIKIFDFYGAALSGFLVQWTVMRIREIAVERMLRENG